MGKMVNLTELNWIGETVVQGAKIKWILNFAFIDCMTESITVNVNIAVNSIAHFNK